MGLGRRDHRHLCSLAHLGPASTGGTAAVVYRASVPELDAQKPRHHRLGILVGRLPPPLRAEICRLCEEVPQWWDGDVVLLQVTESSEQAMQLRALVTARNSPDCWDLPCHVREAVINFIQREYPDYLPRTRALVEIKESPQRALAPHTSL